MTTTSPGDDAPGRRGASGGQLIRAVLLVVLLVAAAVTAWTVGSPGIAQVRAQVDAAGRWAPVAFVAGYALWSLLPVPKNVVTVLAGGLFGFLPGALLAWLGAMLGALAAFGIARWLGRDGVDALLRGRLRQVDATLHDRGLVAVLTVRLVPVLPFTVINYGAGVTGVTLGDYVLGTALGMLPGTLAYAAVGACGMTRPWVVWVAAGVLVVLVVVGGGLSRRGAGGADTAPTGRSGPERGDVRRRAATPVDAGPGAAVSGPRPALAQPRPAHRRRARLGLGSAVAAAMALGGRALACGSRRGPPDGLDGPLARAGDAPRPSRGPTAQAGRLPGHHRRLHRVRRDGRRRRDRCHLDAAAAVAAVPARAARLLRQRRGVPGVQLDRRTDGRGVGTTGGR